MNPFASHHQQTIDALNDPPHQVTIRKLPGRHLQRALIEKQRESVTQFRQLGGATFQRELDALRDRDAEKRDQTTAAAPADPLNGFDPYVLMRFGIVSWTYPEPLDAVVVVDETTPKVLEAIRQIAGARDKGGTIAAAAAALVEAAQAARQVVPAQEDLDDDAVEYYARAILRLSKPALFRSADELEADRKNG